MIARVCIATLCAVLASAVSAATEYADRTDKQLTQLAANWANLSEDQRRALLTEIKARMHSSAGKVPVLTIKTERRYGRLVRQPDGSVIRIETTQQHTIRYQPLPEGAADQPFGVGFEQRSTAGGTEPPSSAGNVPSVPPSSQAASTAVSSPSPVHANAIPVVPVGHAK